MMAFSRCLAALLFAVALAASPASAAVTITNFNGAGTGNVDQITHRDQNNSALEFHDGSLLQVGSTIYAYMSDHSCGWVYSTTSAPWCGVRVYSTTDLVNWTSLGVLFDPSITFWQNRCDALNNALSGCFRYKMIYNAANNNYVMWINQFATSPRTAAAQSFFVLVCATPVSGCVVQADPSHIANGVGASKIGDENLFVDSTGTAYLIYSQISPNHVFIDQLNANYTDSTGTSIDTGLTGEAVWMFTDGTTFYAGAGSACGYCTAGGSNVYRSATTPLGTYGSQKTIGTASACPNTQNQGVYPVTGGGLTTYLFIGDQWAGGNNEGFANAYFQPLSFTGNTIDVYSCNATVSVPGFTLGTPPTIQPTGADQSSVAEDVFHDICDTSSTLYRMQTFVPTKANLGFIYMALAENHYVGCSIGSACPSPNGDLTVSITTVDGSNNPVATLSSAIAASGSLNWATTWIRVPVTATLTPGATYGIVLSATNTTGCYGVPLFFGTATNPYPAGVERISTNGGVSWTTESARALMFSTFEPQAAAITGPGRRLIRDQTIRPAIELAPLRIAAPRPLMPAAQSEGDAAPGKCQPKGLD